jgi:hypothetical protein
LRPGSRSGASEPAPRRPSPTRPAFYGTVNGDIMTGRSETSLTPLKPVHGDAGLIVTRRRYCPSAGSFAPPLVGPTIERRFLTTTVSWFTSVPARSHFATIAEAMGAGLLRVFSGTSRRLLARAGHGRSGYPQLTAPRPPRLAGVWTGGGITRCEQGQAKPTVLQTSPKYGLTCGYVPRFRTSPRIRRAVRAIHAGGRPQCDGC